MNNTVITISEEYHGFMGIADSVKSAIKWLIKEKWITGSDCMWDVVPIKVFYGDEWQDKLSDMSIKEFNDYYDGYFMLCEIELIHED